MLFRILILATALLCADSVLAQQKLEVGDSEYYPLAVGTRWEYPLGLGSMVAEVTKHEEVEGVLCARIEGKMTGAIRIIGLAMGERPPKTIHQHIRITDDGVYLHKIGDDLFSPPLLFLKLPVTEQEESWESESRKGEALYSRKFTVSKGQVTVRGTEYPDVLICNSEIQDGEFETKETVWFARGVGIVKKSIESLGAESIMELEKFSPAPTTDSAAP